METGKEKRGRLNGKSTGARTEKREERTKKREGWKKARGSLEVEADANEDEARTQKGGILAKGRPTIATQLVSSAGAQIARQERRQRAGLLAAAS